MNFDQVDDNQFKKILSRISPTEREVLTKARTLHIARKSPGHFAHYATGGTTCELEDHTACIRNNYHWSWADHLKVLNDALVDASENQRFYIISLPPRSGKETRTDEPVLTTNGWSTVGELEVGDYVFHPSGKPVKVLAKSEVNVDAPKLRVYFTDGTNMDVHPNHEWTVRDRRKKIKDNYVTLETKEMAAETLFRKGRDKIDGIYRYGLPPVSPLEFPDDFPIDPKILPTKARRFNRIGQVLAIKKITKAPNADGQCIQVDSEDGLFLAGRSLIPTHNSYLSSGFNPAWFIGTYPDKNILLISHTASLAKGFGQQSRDLIQEFGPEVFGIEIDDSTSAKEEWGIKDHKGKVYSMGVSGSITGKGGHLVIIDDPIKNQQDAFSKTKREHLQNMYQNAIRTRLMPGGSIVLIMTRWSPYDLAGWLLEEDTDRGWKEIRMPMLCDDPLNDPLGRAVNEPMWPEQFDEQACLLLKKDVSPTVWNALYQQKPMTQENTMFPSRDWERAQALPAGCRMVRRWDLSAGSTDDSDYTAGVLVAMDENARVYIVDVRQFKLKEHETEKAVREVAMWDKDNYPNAKTIIEQAGGAGKIVADNYVRKVLAGFDATSKSVSPMLGDKTDRAIPFSAQVQAGNVYVVQEFDEESGRYKDPWWYKIFSQEAFEFPGGKNDDMIDAACSAYLDLSMSDIKDLRKSARMQTVSPSMLRSGGYNEEPQLIDDDVVLHVEEAERAPNRINVVSASDYRRKFR